ncbi:hypothetical protein ON010_g12894 [Phytophthora cinnamomi]|nr:hypothetical protein ON010_g12894 [Phytophthora cinnamomi]
MTPYELAHSGHVILAAASVHDVQRAIAEAHHAVQFRLSFDRVLELVSAVGVGRRVLEVERLPHYLVQRRIQLVALHRAAQIPFQLAERVGARGAP